jgi:magnesium-transporting ATPase (P-type)
MASIRNRKSSQKKLVNAIFILCKIFSIFYIALCIFWFIAIAVFIYAWKKSGEPLTIDGNPEAKVGVPIILFLGFLDTVSYWLGFWIFSKIRRSGKASNHWYAIFLWFTIPACISIIHIPLLILVEIHYAREKQKQ